jgi:O-antigen/teichoic acid export membrane protein
VSGLEADLAQTEIDNITLKSAPSRRRPSLIINAFSNWAPIGVSIITGLLITPYLFHRLGKRDFGIWALAGSLVGYYGLLRLNIGSAIMRYVPFHAGRGDDKGVCEIVSTALAIFLFVGSAILALSLLLADPIRRFYEAGPELATLVRIMGLAVAIECPMRIFSASVMAQERWVAANVVTIATRVLRALGLAGCLYFGYGLVEMGYVVLAVTVSSLILIIAVFIKFCPTIHLRVSMIRLSRFRSIILFGILTTIVTISYAWCLESHKLIIGKLISLESVALYAVVVMLVKQVRELVAAPSRVLWPRFALLDGENNRQELRHLFRKGTQYCSIFASWIILLFVVAGPSFIDLWMGKGFEAVYSVLIILAAGCLVETSLAINSSFLGGIGRQAVQAVFAAIEMIIGLTLSITLGRRMGLMGIALGFTISVILIRGLGRTWYICHFLDMSIFRYYGACLLRPWLVVGLLAALIRCVRFEQYVQNWLYFVIFVMAVSCAYILCAYSIVMNDEERKDIQCHLQKLCRHMLVLIGISK